MKAIVTVVGKDKVGIIAAVCNCLARRQVNVLDISQTILQDYFNMIMIVECAQGADQLNLIENDFEHLQDELGVRIKIQHEDIFNIMHRV